MLSKREMWIETAAVAAATTLIPLYMGIVHISPIGAAAYAGIGGVAMAAGEELQFRRNLRHVTFWDIGLWAAAISGVGGLAYLFALLLL